MQWCDILNAFSNRNAAEYSCGGGVERTWKELCTSVSSRSRAKHFLPVPGGGGALISGIRWGGLRVGLKDMDSISLDEMRWTKSS